MINERKLEQREYVFSILTYWLVVKHISLVAIANRLLRFLKVTFRVHHRKHYNSYNRPFFSDKLGYCKIIIIIIFF